MYVKSAHLPVFTDITDVVAPLVSSEKVFTWTQMSCSLKMCVSEDLSADLAGKFLFCVETFGRTAFLKPDPSSVSNVTELSLVELYF